MSWKFNSTLLILISRSILPINSYIIFFENCELRLKGKSLPMYRVLTLLKYPKCVKTSISCCMENVILHCNPESYYRPPYTIFLRYIAIKFLSAQSLFIFLSRHWTTICPHRFFNWSYVLNICNCKSLRVRCRYKLNFI